MNEYYKLNIKIKNCKKIWLKIVKKYNIIGDKLVKI